MRYLLMATALSLFSAQVMAEDFSEKKQHHLDYLDQKIQRLQEHKACVQVASDQDALRNCKQEKEEEMRDLKSKKKKKMKNKQKQTDLRTGTDEASEEEYRED